MAKVKIMRYSAGYDDEGNPKEGDIRGVGFICPGCGQDHTCATDNYHAPGNDYLWGFNGDFDRPTFTPSLLWRSGHYAQAPTPERPYCWHNPAPGIEPRPEWCYQCHSFVNDGRIQFLGDCSHALAGQTVELPEIE